MCLGRDQVQALGLNSAEFSEVAYVRLLFILNEAKVLWLGARPGSGVG